MKLRDYQIDAVEALSERLQSSNDALCVSPTGSGKTEIMIELLRRSPGLKKLVLINRVGLVEQTRARFNAAGLPSTVYCATLKEKNISELTVSSIHSIHTVEDLAPDLVIMDEVHNYSEEADSSRYAKVINRYKNNGRTKFIGFTATPFRASGYIFGAGEKLFEEETFRIPLQELIDRGYLVKPITKKTDNEFDTSKLRVRRGEWAQEDIDKLVEDEEKLELQVTEALSRLIDRRKTFWMAGNISHAERIFLKLKTKGELSSIVHSKLSYEDRLKELKAFEEGLNKHCVFVSILAEGYNYPPADALVLLRPIRSPVLYVQSAGRILRPFEGKKDALLLDFGQVRRFCGALDNPDIRKKREREPSEKTSVWVCACYTYNMVEATECADCGAPRPETEGVKSTPEQNTTLASDSDLELLSKWEPPKQWRFKVKEVKVFSHHSKNGNLCLKIIYSSDPKKLFDHGSITEYIPLHQDWGRIKASTRLKSFGLPLTFELKPDESLFAKSIPSEIIYEEDGNYNKVKRVIFDHDGGLF